MLEHEARPALWILTPQERLPLMMSDVARWMELELGALDGGEAQSTPTYIKHLCGPRGQLRSANHACKGPCTALRRRGQISAYLFPPPPTPAAAWSRRWIRRRKEPNSDLPGAVACTGVPRPSDLLLVGACWCSWVRPL